VGGPQCSLQNYIYKTAAIRLTYHIYESKLESTVKVNNSL